MTIKKFILFCFFGLFFGFIAVSLKIDSQSIRDFVLFGFLSYLIAFVISLILCIYFVVSKSGNKYLHLASDEKYCYRKSDELANIARKQISLMVIMIAPIICYFIPLLSVCIFTILFLVMLDNLNTLICMFSESFFVDRSL